MPWFGVDGVWQQRAAITLYSSSDLAQDFDVTIPAGWDNFWEEIDASGNELRVTDALGTLLDYGIDNGSGGAFSKTSRLGRLRINNYDTPISTGGATLCWLYFDSTSAQGSAAGTTGGGGQSGWIELAHPTGSAIFPHKDHRPGGTFPPYRISKSAASQRDVWIGYGAHTARAHQGYYASSLLEEVYYSLVDVVDTAGSSVSSMYDADRIRYVWIPKGPMAGTWLRMPVIAGTTGTNYTLTVLTRIVSPIQGLADPRAALDTRVGVYVRDVRLTS